MTCRYQASPQPQIQILIGASKPVLLAADGIYGLCARVKLVVKGDDMLKPHDVTQRSSRREVIRRTSVEAVHQRADARVSHRKTHSHTCLIDVEVVSGDLEP
jgi:hypothetical protein